MNLKDKICSFDSLYTAMLSCKKGVFWKPSVQTFWLCPMNRLTKLEQDLLNDKYQISPYSKFVVFEPKRRDILATKLRDRIFQRSLCTNYLYETLINSFIVDNAACQKGGGTEFSRKRLVEHLRRFYVENETNEGWALKIDIKNYFGSTPHYIAKEAVEKRATNKWVREKVYQVIDSFPGEIGMGLGSELVQLIQLAVLDDLDHHIKEFLKVKHYVRYMDDMILIHKDKDTLKEFLEKISFELKMLDLQVNKNKTTISRLEHGVKYLGSKYCLTNTGKITATVLDTKLNNEKRHLKSIVNLAKNPNSPVDKETADSCFFSYISYISNSRKHAIRTNGRIIEKMFKYYDDLWNGYEDCGSFTNNDLNCGIII